VLLDEVGAGTDRGEGAALAIALLRHLAVGPARATTHVECELKGAEIRAIHRSERLEVGS